MHTIRVLIPRQPCAPAIALFFLLNGDGLDKGADAAKDRVDASAYRRLPFLWLQILFGSK